MSVLNATVSLKNEENIFLTTSFPSSSPTWILACEPDAISFHFISSMIAFEKYFTPQTPKSVQRARKNKGETQKGKREGRLLTRIPERVRSGTIWSSAYISPLDVTKEFLLCTINPSTFFMSKISSLVLYMNGKKKRKSGVSLERAKRGRKGGANQGRGTRTE